MAGLLDWLPEIGEQYRLGQALGGLDLNGNPDDIDTRAKALLGSGNPQHIGIALKLIETSRKMRDQQNSLAKDAEFENAFKSFMGGGGTPAITPPAAAPAPGPQTGMVAPLSDMDEVSGQSRVPQAPRAPVAPGVDQRIAAGQALLARATNPGQRAAISSMIQSLMKQQEEGRAEGRTIAAEKRAADREAAKNQRELNEQIDTEARKDVLAAAAEKRRSEININEKEAEHLFKAQADIFADGRKAATERDSIRTARGILEDPQFYTGIGGAVIGGVGRRLAPLYQLGLRSGLDPDSDVMKGLRGAKNAAELRDSFDAMSKKLTLDNLGGKLGAQISDSDRNFVSAIYTSLDNTIEGNRARLIILDKFAERKEKIAELAREYPGRSQRELEKIIADYNKANPIFSPDEKNAIRQSTTISEDKARSQSESGYKILGVR